MTFVRRWLTTAWRAVRTVWTRTVTLETQVLDLQQEVARLGVLLKGVERTSSPDGVPGWYFEGRVGVLTKYFLLQKTGHGAALSCATSWDHYGFHAVNEAGDLAERIAIVAQAISQNDFGTNTAIRALAAHAPKGNVAVHAQAGLSMQATDKLTIITSERYQ